MEWSKEQEAIFEWAANNQYTLVNADAGSGKSTVLFELIKRLCKNEPSLMLSFNADIANENIKRAKKLGLEHTEIRTFHGWAYDSFPKNRRKGLNVLKVWEYAKSVGKSQGLTYQEINDLTHVLSQCRQMGVMPLSSEYVASQIESNIALNLRADMKKHWKRHADTLVKHLTALLESKGKLDFDDMCCMPLHYSWLKDVELPNYLFVDEIQDLNQSQIDLIREFIKYKPQAKVIMVGDTKQNLYSFRGSIKSFEKCQALLGVEPLGLPTTYRCKERIMQFVNKVIPKSKGIAYNSGGQVIKLTEDTLEEAVDAGVSYKPDMIISQKNSVLVKTWVYLHKQGIQANLKGSKIVPALKEVLKLNSDDIPKLRIFLRQLAEAKYTKVVGQADLALGLLHIIDDMGIRYRTDLLEVLGEMDSDDPGIPLETVHSAKGREASTVLVICDWFNDRTDTLDNVRYVAYTRAIDKLVVCRY